MNRDVTPRPHEARRRRNDPEDSQAHAHRRASDSEAVLRLHDRVGDTERRLDTHDELLGTLAANMGDLTKNTGRLADVLEAWSNIRGFWWTLKMMGCAVKLLMPFILFGTAVLAAVWLYGKTGVWEWKL